MTNEEVPPKTFLLCPYGEQHYTKDGKEDAFRREGPGSRLDRRSGEDGGRSGGESQLLDRCRRRTPAKRKVTI